MSEDNQETAALLRAIATSMANLSTSFRDMDTPCEVAFASVSILAEMMEKTPSLPQLPELRQWLRTLQECQDANRRLSTATLRLIDRAEMLANEASGES